MTDQPRDLAKEVEEIRLQHAKRDELRDKFAPLHHFRDIADQAHDNCTALLAFIAFQSGEIELQREALRWALEGNRYSKPLGRFCDGGCGCCESEVDPPAHLREVLEQALRSET